MTPRGLPWATALSSPCGVQGERPPDVFVCCRPRPSRLGDFLLSSSIRMQALREQQFPEIEGKIA